MAAIDIEQVLANPDGRVVINAKEFGRGVQGWIAGDLQFGGSNSFSEPLASQQQESLNNMIAKFQGVLSTATGKSFEQPYSALVFENSNYVWSGSDRPKFTVPMFFVALRPGDDVRANVLTLFKGVFPSASDEGKGRFMSPPLGYLPSIKGTDAKGTVQVTIGKWFQANNLVMRSVEPRFSKETVANGTPLYVELSITFEAYRVMSYNEVAQFFKQGGGS